MRISDWSSDVCSSDLVVVMSVIVAVMVVMLAMPVIVWMPVIVCMAGADAFDVVMVALLRQADFGLEAQHLLAVLAHLAVHVAAALHAPLDTRPAGAQNLLGVEIGQAACRKEGVDQ